MALNLKAKCLRLNLLVSIKNCIKIYMKNNSQLNVFDKKLEICSKSPLTGFFRDGCCNTSNSDFGQHIVCAIMTDKFLNFSLNQGNDLITPRRSLNFNGLKEGDRWCLCANRWLEALKFSVPSKKNYFKIATNKTILKKLIWKL